MRSWLRTVAWWRDRWVILAALVVAYLPLILSSPGRVAANTKVYLFLDPAAVLGNALSIWDADRALGTVTHQSVGYLWPMGPFFWFFDTLGVPDWVTQRLWMGTIIAAAGLGVLYLLRTLHFSGAGVLVAVLAYELSPYFLHYHTNFPVVALPWAGLGWMLGLTIRALRTGKWRYPALFALVVTTVGSVNASSLMLAGLAPVVWIVHAVITDREVTVNRALATTARIGVMTLSVSLWWIVGLLLQGAHSLPVTRYTETYETVASASSAAEVLRSLGYWAFYFGDTFGPTVPASVNYTQGGWLIFISFGLAVLALGCAAITRWRHRSYFVLLIALGTIISVGAHPIGESSLLGRLIGRAVSSDLGLAMRSLPRAVPLIALGVAVLLGAGVNAAWQRAPRTTRALSLLVLAAIVLNNPVVWQRSYIAPQLSRNEHIPSYWHDAASSLDTTATDAEPFRVWEVPGSDFGSYRWGTTIDPITPGLMERGYVARELVLFGSEQSAALLSAIDRRMQEGTLDPASLGRVARLMSVGDVVHRGDLSFERYGTPRPAEMDELLDAAEGLALIETFGEPTHNIAGPQRPILDAIDLARPPDQEPLAPVSRFEVTDPLPIVRTHNTQDAVVLVGDADGIVDAAAAGLLTLDTLLFFAGDLLAEGDTLHSQLSDISHVIVTDSNRRRAQRWGMLRENRGYTEAPGEVPLAEDPHDNRLPQFRPSVVGDSNPDDSMTVAKQVGPVTAQASAYGSPLKYTPEDRAFHAIDGFTQTAWLVGDGANVHGERLQLTLTEPTYIDFISFHQWHDHNRRFVAQKSRRITEIEIIVDGELHSVVSLDKQLTTTPQIIELSTDAQVIDFVIADTDLGQLANYDGIGPVGFFEVDLGLGSTVEIVRVPRALTDYLGNELKERDLSIVLTRERADSRVWRVDPESHLSRSIPMPISRQFTLSGTATLAEGTGSNTVESMLGSHSQLVVTASSRLPGQHLTRPEAAFDHDTATAWKSSLGSQSGQWIEVTSTEGQFDRNVIELDIVVDERHSTPLAVRVTLDGTEQRTFETKITAADEGTSTANGTVQTVTLPVEVSADTARFEFIEVTERVPFHPPAGLEVALPIAIAEIRIGETDAPQLPAQFDTGCRNDLLELNNQPIAVRVTGTTQAALSGKSLTLEGCEPVTLTAGDNLITSSLDTFTGLDVDQVVLTSLGALDKITNPAPVSATRHSATHYSGSVGPASSDQWLVLGQSYNRGWHAYVDDEDLGPGVAINGFANGWRLTASEEWRDFELRWVPQRLLTLALFASLGAVVVALLIVFWPRKRRDHLSTQFVAVEPFAPTLVLPNQVPVQPPLRISLLITAGIAAAVLAAVNLPTTKWWYFCAVPLAAAATVMASRLRPLRQLPGALAALSLGVAALYVLIQQYRFHYPPIFGWPQLFELAHFLGVTAVLFLLSDYIVAMLSARSK